MFENTEFRENKVKILLDFSWDGLGLHSPFKRLPNRHCSRPRHHAAIRNRGPTACNRTAGPMHLSISPAAE